jgi:hypothetical protein
MYGDFCALRNPRSTGRMRGAARVAHGGIDLVVACRAMPRIGSQILRLFFSHFFDFSMESCAFFVRAEASPAHTERIQNLRSEGETDHPRVIIAHIFEVTWDLILRSNSTKVTPPYISFSATQGIQEVSRGDRAQLGHVVMRIYLDPWSDPILGANSTRTISPYIFFSSTQGIQEVPRGGHPPRDHVVMRI